MTEPGLQVQGIPAPPPPQVQAGQQAHNNRDNMYKCTTGTANNTPELVSL